MEDNQMVKKEQATPSIQREVRERTAGYIMAAFGLVIGLAWNDAVKSVIEEIFPIKKNTLTAKVIYATAITLLFVFVTTYVNSLFKKEVEEEEEGKTVKY